MKNTVEFLIQLGYNFHEAVAIENARLWVELEIQKAKEDKR